MTRRSEIPGPSGYARIEALESRNQTDDVAVLVGIGDFLAPEMHRERGFDTAASAVLEWAEDDIDMIAAAERIARRRHHDDSAEILHRALVLAAA
jgi:hypothetical protein